MSIYGNCQENLTVVMNRLVSQIEAYAKCYEEEHGERLYEHLRCRVKSEESMLDKLQRRGLEPTSYNALRTLTDSVGLRVICLFIDDVYENAARIRALPGVRVIREKDYIQNSKPNGYRSYHMILDVETDLPDVEGNLPGHYYAEVQLRTIAMDTWAALEHELKYKKDIRGAELISQELHRCANELAACDVSMQTLKRIIREI